MFILNFLAEDITAINIGWIGMLTIFIGIGVIYLTILLLNALSKKEK